MKMKLYIVPFAGGSSYSFKHMIPLLSDAFDVKAWDGKGIGTRADETPNTEFFDEVADLTEFIMADNGDAPYAIWGYSCGGLIVYETLHALKKKGYHMPVKVFLAAVRPAAEFRSPHTQVLSDEELLPILMRMSGAKDPEPLLKNIGPTRYGMEMARLYKYVEKGPIDAPACVMTADDDFVTEKGVSNWSNYFTGEVVFKVFHGGRHFFYRKHLGELADYIKEQLGEYI